MKNRITIENIQDLFFKMELAEDMFSLQMTDGTYYWDLVRRQVYLSLHTIHGGPFATSEILPAKTIATKIKNVVKMFINLISRRYLVTQAPKFIFITGQRIRRGTSLVDNISDHLCDLVSKDAVAVELMNKAEISYWKLISGGKTRVPQVAVRTMHGEIDISHAVITISSVINKYFNVSIDVYNLIAEPITTFFENRNYYIKLFAIHRPNAVICINNGTLDGLFHAAKEMGVPVIELQHGASSSKTIFWSYPQSIQSNHPGLSLPTAYLTYSDFWNDNTNYPVSMKRSIGSDYFHQELIAGKDDGVLIVSAYMYHEDLLGLAIELATLVENKKIYYKLHPHQFSKMREVVAACSGKGNIVVICDELDFSELYQRCNYVVGIHSTTLYIALQAGKKVCLYKRSNYFWHDDIFEYVELFDNASELRNFFDNSNGKYFSKLHRAPIFFEPFDEKKYMQVLEDVNSHI